MQHSNCDISRRRGLLRRGVLIHKQRPHEIRSNGDGDLERPRVPHRRRRRPGAAARLAARLAIGPIRIAPRHAVRGLDGPLDAAPQDLARVRRRVEPALAEAPELGPLARGSRQPRRVRLGVGPQRELPLAVDAQPPPPLLAAEAPALAEPRAQVSVALDGAQLSYVGPGPGQGVPAVEHLCDQLQRGLEGGPQGLVVLISGESLVTNAGMPAKLQIHLQHYTPLVSPRYRRRP